MVLTMAVGDNGWLYCGLECPVSTMALEPEWISCV